jgi:hypothetical protein
VQADLADTKKQLDAEKGKNTDAQSQVADLTRINTGLKKTVADDVEACKASTKVAVDNEKKKHKWYAIGGVVIFEAIKIYFTGKA